MIAVEMAKAVEPAAKAVQALILVERARRNKASLSVSSAMNMAEAMVAKAPRRVVSSKRAANEEPLPYALRQS